MKKNLCRNDLLIILMLIGELLTYTLLISSLKANSDELVIGGTSSIESTNDYFVYPGDVDCGEDGIIRTPPNKEIVESIIGCIQYEIRSDVFNYKLLPAGTPWLPSQLDFATKPKPFVAWYNSPRYVYGWDGSNPSCQPCWVCAAGVSGFPAISVSLKDRTRVLRLVAWETTNFYITQIGRWDLIDSTVVAAYTNKCAPFFNYVLAEHVIFHIPHVIN